MFDRLLIENDQNDLLPMIKHMPDMIKGAECLPDIVYNKNKLLEYVRSVYSLCLIGY